MFKNHLKKIVLITFLMSGFVGMSQTNSTIRIMDLHLIQDMITESTDTALVNYKLQFKIDTVALANKVNILLGTAANAGNVFTTQAVFNHADGIERIVYENQDYAVNGYTVYLLLRLSKPQSASFKYVSVYIEDNSGNYTPKLSLQVND